MNKHPCVDLLRALAAVLLPFLDRYQPVLFLDAFRGHVAWEVFAECSRLGLWPVVVPSMLTCIL